MNKGNSSLTFPATNSAPYAGHTAGPWTAEPRGHDWHVFTESVRSVDGGRHTVAMPMDGTPEQCAANARLIAAAPDLLEGLKRAVAMIDTDQGPPNWDWLRSIIAKAEGADGAASPRERSGT